MEEDEEKTEGRRLPAASLFWLCLRVGCWSVLTNELEVFVGALMFKRQEKGEGEGAIFNESSFFARGRGVERMRLCAQCSKVTELH